MNGRTFLIVSIVGALMFILGWFVHSTMLPSNQTQDTQVFNGFIDTVSQADTVKSNDFSHIISGRFILTKSNCAGLNFINKDVVLWTNEIACNEPDTLTLRWLTDSTFMTRSTLRSNESCPPVVDLYKVVSLNSKHLILKSIWTGWKDAADETLEFIKQPD